MQAAMARPTLAVVFLLAAIIPLASFVLTSCRPRVVVEAPKEPIVINLNVKIEHEIRVQIDKDLDDLLEDDEDLF